VRDHIIRPQERACQHELVYDDDIAALAASEARRLSRSCSRLLPRPAPQRIYEERNALLRYL